jgi:predicted CoA-binding protein
MKKTTLVLGASPNPERFSNEALKALMNKEIPVIAVGKREADLGDLKITKSFPKGAGRVHTITLYLSAKNQEEYYDLIFSLTPVRIIFNPGTTNNVLADMARKRGIIVIDDCMLSMLKKGIF